MRWYVQSSQTVSKASRSLEPLVLDLKSPTDRWPRTVIYQVVKNLFDVPTAAAVIDGSFLSTAEAILWESLGFSSMIYLGMYTFDSLWRYGSRMSTALELEFCSASQTTHHVGIIVHLPSVILNFLTFTWGLPLIYI